MLAAGLSKDDARRHAVAVGLPLGLAFQLADDLWTLSDQAGIPENLLAEIFAKASVPCFSPMPSTLRMMGSDVSLSTCGKPIRVPETQVQRAIELFGQTGAIARSRNRIADLWHASKSAIDALDLSEYRKSPLVEACARFVPDIRANA